MQVRIEWPLVCPSVMSNACESAASTSDTGTRIRGATGMAAAASRTGAAASTAVAATCLSFFFRFEWVWDMNRLLGARRYCLVLWTTRAIRGQAPGAQPPSIQRVPTACSPPNTKGPDGLPSGPPPSLNPEPRTLNPQLLHRPRLTGQLGVPIGRQVHERGHHGSVVLHVVCHQPVVDVH